MYTIKDGSLVITTILGGVVLFCRWAPPDPEEQQDDTCEEFVSTPERVQVQNTQLDERPMFPNITTQPCFRWSFV